MAKCKVLQVHTLPVISGSGIHALITLKGLDRSKYEVEFACAPGGALIEEVLEQGITFRPIKHFVQPVSPLDDIRALWEMIYLLKHQNYDIIHTHNSKAGFIARLAAKISGVPIIVHTIHGFAFHEFENPPRQKLFILLERFAGRFADKLITVSEPLKEWGLRLGIASKDKYVTIYDGIDIEGFRSNFDLAKKKKEFGIPQTNLVVGAVSKLWEGKGHRQILQAAKKVIAEIPNVTFMFVGQGYLEDELKQLSEELGLRDHVIFTGFRHDIPEVTAIFDIAILASFFEGLGRVLLEAMACGVPTVATRVGGIVDVVDDAKTGILVEPGDVSSLASAIIRLLKDKDLRERLGKAGKEKIDSKFSAKTMVRRIEEVYDDLLSRKIPYKDHR